MPLREVLTPGFTSTRTEILHPTGDGRTSTAAVRRRSGAASSRGCRIAGFGSDGAALPRGHAVRPVVPRTLELTVEAREQGLASPCIPVKPPGGERHSVALWYFSGGARFPRPCLQGAVPRQGGLRGHHNSLKGEDHLAEGSVLDEQRMTILAIPGSLRRHSYNRALLVAARGLAPGRVEVDIYEDGPSIPLFNQDLEGDLTPLSVLKLRRRIRAADAILIASPEYNSSIPGVLKNLIDWASRPYGQSAFSGKPVAVVGASPSRFGAQWAQETAIAVLSSAEASVTGGPHPVREVAELVDSEGNIGDEETMRMLSGVLAELAEAAGPAPAPNAPV